ncbi:MAG TPA: redoxin domain-containing protein [Pirellulales bacterium]|jgi:hypothetical protein|nr:redoxin domain-containing protein [Pirellulales bacterium]
MAPDLVQIQRYFQDDGVVFISLSPDDEAEAERFARRNHIGWPMGWGAGEVIKRYLGKEYPALLVIGRDGRVAWNDGTSRLQHRGQDGAVQLFEQIRRAL